MGEHSSVILAKAWGLSRVRMCTKCCLNTTYHRRWTFEETSWLILLKSKDSRWTLATCSHRQAIYFLIRVDQNSPDVNSLGFFWMSFPGGECLWDERQDASWKADIAHSSKQKLRSWKVSSSLALFRSPYIGKRLKWNGYLKVGAQTGYGKSQRIQLPNQWESLLPYQTFSFNDGFKFIFRP